MICKTNSGDIPSLKINPLRNHAAQVLWQWKPKTMVCPQYHCWSSTTSPPTTVLRVSRGDSLTVSVIVKPKKNPKLEEAEMDALSSSKQEDPTLAVDSKDDT